MGCLYGRRFKTMTYETNEIIDAMGHAVGCGLRR